MNTLRKLGAAIAVALTATAAPSIPARAAAPTAVSGTFVFDTDDTCKGEPPGFEDFTFVISGDLEGCWYTNVGPSWNLGPPSGHYFEAGREVFDGELRGHTGTFRTTYTFESQWDPQYPNGTEIWGRCQHLIARGSGTDELRNVTGFIARTDTATDGTRGVYRGFVRLQ